MRLTPGTRSGRDGVARSDRSGLRTPPPEPGLTLPPHDVPVSLAHLFVRDVMGERLEKITSTPYRIGRRETNDLRLCGMEVSREHAEIVRDGSTFRLIDRGSSYGTFVNARQVTDHALESGDRIRLGRGGGADLVFSLEDTAGLASHTGSNPITDIHQLATLLEGLRALGPGHLLHEVLAHVLDSAIALSGTERGFIMLARGGELHFAIGRTRSKATLDDGTFDTNRKIPEAAFATGQPQVVADLQARDLISAPPTR